MNRRAFLKAAAATSVYPFLQRRSSAVESDGPAYPGLLDTLRDKIHRWTESLWDPDRNGFRQNDQIGVNLMSTTDVAWMRYAVNDPNLHGRRRMAWIRCLQQGQDAKTGKVSYGPGRGGQGHPDGHAMWHTVRALNILGGQLLHFPHYLRKVTTPAGLEAWFDAVDWDGSPWNHHEVLGLVPLLVNLDDARWTGTFYKKIVEQQNPDNGCFPRSKVSISRTFAYTALHRATGRMPPRADKIVDTILTLQNPHGFWEKQPNFHTMDAVYILLRLPVVLDYRRRDARRALQRIAEALTEYYPQHAVQIMQNPHRMLAIVHTFGLLQEAFPEGFPSRRPYRFDWDKPSLYRCDVIRNELKRS